MPRRISWPTLLLVYGFFSSGCVLVSQRKSWQYTQLIPKTEQAKPFIQINLEKPTIPLPLPIIMWEISTAKRYCFDIDFLTKNRQYQRLDSIGFALYTPDKQLVASGVLPIVNGELSYRPYSPDVHRAQCQTSPRIALGNQRQELTGTFVLYATDLNNQRALIPLDGVALHYFKARIASFF